MFFTDVIKMMPSGKISHQSNRLNSDTPLGAFANIYPFVSDEITNTKLVNIVTLVLLEHSFCQPSARPLTCPLLVPKSSP